MGKKKTGIELGSYATPEEAFLVYKTFKEKLIKKNISKKNILGFDISKIKYILNTHNHDDHFNQNTVDYLTSQGAKLIKAEPNMAISLGEYSILPLKGNHSVPVCHFIIEHNGKRMFYGLDGAWLLYEEIDAIWTRGVDLAVFDATVGFIDGDYRIFEHNNPKGNSDKQTAEYTC